MPRDFKNAGSKKKSESRFFSYLLTFSTGLAVGLFVAFVFYLRVGPPVVADQPAPPPSRSNSEPPAVETAPSVEPRFDFYTILPEMEVKVQEWEVAESEPIPDNSDWQYLLQVGSFQKFRDADRVKAQLALQGIAANIQRVVINGQDVWFRVLIGPDSDRKQLERLRSRLSESGMSPMLVKVKPEGTT